MYFVRREWDLRTAVVEARAFEWLQTVAAPFLRGRNKVMLF